MLQTVVKVGNYLLTQFTHITTIHLVEKIIELGEISLVDFLGIENENVRKVAESFPKSKIISRGSQIRIQGTGTEILKINSTFNDLIAHYNKYGKITTDHVQKYIEKEKTDWDRADQDDVLIYGTKGVAIKPKSENQQKLVDAAKKDDLIFAIGPAGTGKTYVAVALAVRALKNKQVKRIIITRPAVEAGENLGFLPGDLRDKVDPYLRPIYDALNDMIPSEKLKYYFENNIVEIAPLAYMRGRTLNKAFILLDEAQNTTPMQMKMFLTRMGPDSKMIITGDTSQIDLPRNHKSGLVEAVKVLGNVGGISIIKLEEMDVIRHRLVKRIIAAYGEEDKAREQRKLETKALGKEKTFSQESRS